VGTTYARAAAETARTLEDAGFSLDEARRDAGVLGRGLLGWDAARWIARLNDDAPASFLARLKDAATRRAEREPVAYLVGTREFFGRPFIVSNAVLIPRPETELVVIEALECLRGRPNDQARSPVIVDVGTGSGCLAVTIALEWPAADVTATDISTAALDVARRNAAALDVSRRVTFQCAALIGDMTDAADLVVSNPPYVAERDRASLAPDVRDYEPSTALFGGDDGLDVIRALLPDARRALRAGGALVMEIGAGQSDAVRNLVEAAGLTWTGVREDLAGIPRVVLAVRP
jgi:release factor glutamine methyltransferase